MAQVRGAIGERNTLREVVESNDNRMAADQPIIVGGHQLHAIFSFNGPWKTLSKVELSINIYSAQEKDSLDPFRGMLSRLIAKHGQPQPETKDILPKFHDTWVIDKTRITLDSSFVGVHIVYEPADAGTEGL